MRFWRGGLLIKVTFIYWGKLTTTKKYVQYVLLTTEVQNDLYVSVKWMLLCQGDVGCRGTLGTGVCICPQSVSGALQAYTPEEEK